MLLDPVQSKRLLWHALKNHYAILAVNADSQACLYDCLEAARLCSAPIIIETSLWQLEGHSFGAGDAFLGLARYLANLALLANSERFQGVPVIYHTDHIKGPLTLDLLGAAIRGIPLEIHGKHLKFKASTLSLDASDLSEKQNIDTICRLGEIAEETGEQITLEMESAIDEGVTPPEMTRRLVGGVEERHPGLIAVYAPGLGTRHGYSKDGYPEFKTDQIEANVALLNKLTGRDIGLALHGSSGLSENDLSVAAQAGVIKVNWSTDSLNIRLNAAREYFANDTDRFERGHPEWKASAMDNGLQQYISSQYIPQVCDKIKVLNGEGAAMAFNAG